MEKFTVKFAETEQEKMQTYALRYNELILEYRSDKVNESGIDVNDYDEYGKLAICIDNEVNEVVGCYRIITSDDLPCGAPFVSESEFDISVLKQSGEKIAELSRSVVKKEYRGSMVLMLLLRFIIKYIMENDYRYIIGTASFHGLDKKAIQKQISYIAYNHYNPKYHVECLDKEQIEILPEEQLDFAEIRRSLPPLSRAYISFGAFLSKDVFCDYSFGSTDTFVILDCKNYNEKYVKKFLNNLNIN